MQQLVLFCFILFNTFEFYRLRFNNHMVIYPHYYTKIMLGCQYRMVMKVGAALDNYYPRLKDLREDRDLSQLQIANYLGMKQPQYSRYERGLRDIPTDVLIRLAQFYKTSTDYILGLTNNSEPHYK